MYINREKKPEDTFPRNFMNDLYDFFSIRRHLPGRLIYDGVFDSCMYPLQRKRELIKMLELADSINPKVVGEIGADKGGSLYHWCNLLTVERVYACEFRGVPYRNMFNKSFPDLDFLFYHGSSYDDQTIDDVKKWLGADKFDVLFLDGDKCNFFTDYLKYKPLMNKGGIMFLHDINGEPPEEAFNKISGLEHTEKIIDTSEAKELKPDFKPKTAWEDWLKFWGERSCGVGVVYL